jgi:hypothetical protein
MAARVVVDAFLTKVIISSMEIDGIIRKTGCTASGKASGNVAILHHIWGMKNMVAEE